MLPKEGKCGYREECLDEDVGGGEQEDRKMGPEEMMVQVGMCWWCRGNVVEEGMYWWGFRKR